MSPPKKQNTPAQPKKPIHKKYKPPSKLFFLILTAGLIKVFTLNHAPLADLPDYFAQPDFTSVCPVSFCPEPPDLPFPAGGVDARAYYHDGSGDKQKAKDEKSAAKEATKIEKDKTELQKLEDQKAGIKPDKAKILDDRIQVLEDQINNN